MEKNKIIFKKAISEKSGKAYNCIVVDMGYREVTLTFDSAVIAELLDCSPRVLAAVKVGEERVIGYIDVDGTGVTENGKK